MSAAELRISYRPDSEWQGQLDAAVTSGAFSGTGSAWFDKKWVMETFIAALSAFPLSMTEPPKIEGGFWRSKDAAKDLEQCHLRIVSIERRLQSFSLNNRRSKNRQIR